MWGAKKMYLDPVPNAAFLRSSSTLSSCSDEAFGVPVIDPVIVAFHRAGFATRLKLDCELMPNRKWSCEAAPAGGLKRSGIFAGKAFGAHITGAVAS